MMDVIRSQESSVEYNQRIDDVEEMIVNYQNNDIIINMESIINRLNTLGNEIIEGDFGGYYNMKRPLIERIDYLRSLLNIDIPQRDGNVVIPRRSRIPRPRLIRCLYQTSKKK